MKNFALLSLLVIAICSCNSSKSNKKPENPIKKNIIGEWDFINPNGENSTAQIFNKTRFVFLNDSIYEDANGFYEKINDTIKLRAAMRTYKIENDQFLDYIEETSSWDAGKIVKCDKDSLSMETAGQLFHFTRANDGKHEAFDFDEVVLNTYPNFGMGGDHIPMAISVNKNGNVFFQKRSENTDKIKFDFYKSTANKALIENIQRKVNRANINSLKKSYRKDAGAYYIIISFFKNGKVKKSITDMGFSSTKELFWLYHYLGSFSELLDLEKVKREDFLPQFERLDYNTYEDIKSRLKSLDSKRK